MFGSKRKLIDEIMRLKYRVEELEERLCPCGDHDWKQLGYELFGGTGRGDETTIYSYRCKRCGKKQKSIQPFL